MTCGSGAERSALRAVRCTNPSTPTLVTPPDPAEASPQSGAVPIDGTNAEACEELLGWWSTQWDAVAERVRSSARPEPAYGPADFETALCLYQDELRARSRRGFK
jgi:hypothetical protein